MPVDPLLHWKIALAVRAQIAGLVLDGIGERVGLQIVPDLTAYYRPDKEQVIDVLYPAVLITVGENESEEKRTGDTERNDWAYPLRVWVADKAFQRQHGRAPVYLGARKRIRDLYDDPQREFTLPERPEVYGVELTPGVIFDEKLPNYQHLVSGMLLRFLAQEERVKDG